MTSLSKILCIDDDQDIRTITVMALSLDPALDARGAGSGEEALKILRERQWHPDAILIDVMMPGMDGPTLLAAIRWLPHFTQTPVIFMTARAQKQDLDRYRSLGIAGTIIKPFDPLRLASEVRAIVGG